MVRQCLPVRDASGDRPARGVVARGAPFGQEPALPDARLADEDDGAAGPRDRGGPRHERAQFAVPAEHGAVQSGAAAELVRRGQHTAHLVRLHRLGLAFQREPPAVDDVQLRSDRRERFRGHKYGHRGGRRLHSRRDVHRVTGGKVFVLQVVPHGTHDDETGVHTDTDGELDAIRS